MTINGENNRNELGLDLLISKVFLDLYNLINYKEIPRCNIEKAKRIIIEAERLIEKCLLLFIRNLEIV